MPVAEPVTGAFERPGLLDRAWLVDRFVAGEPVGRRPLRDGEVADLATVLRAVHEIPVSGFGRMVDQLAPLVGRAGSMDAGVSSRFQQPWPCSGPPLRDHPLATHAPDLVGAIQPFSGRIAEAANRWPTALTHVDLHGGQMLTQDGRLTALLDFADASVLSPVWDFASLTYFLGPAVARAALKTYEADPDRRQRLAHDGSLVSVAVALHHASRAETLHLPERRARVIAYLTAWLRADCG